MHVLDTSLAVAVKQGTNLISSKSRKRRRHAPICNFSAESVYPGEWLQSAQGKRETFRELFADRKQLSVLRNEWFVEMPALSPAQITKRALAKWSKVDLANTRWPANGIVLMEHQHCALAEIRQHWEGPTTIACIELAVGGGKSYLALSLWWAVRDTIKSLKCVIVCPTTVMMNQWHNVVVSFCGRGVTVEKATPQRLLFGDVTIMTYSTYHILIKEFTFLTKELMVMLDEVHHIYAEGLGATLQMSYEHGVVRNWTFGFTAEDMAVRALTPPYDKLDLPTRRIFELDIPSCVAAGIIAPFQCVQLETAPVSWSANGIPLAKGVSNITVGEMESVMANVATILRCNMGPMMGPTPSDWQRLRGIIYVSRHSQIPQAIDLLVRFGIVDDRTKVSVLHSGQTKAELQSEMSKFANKNTKMLVGISIPTEGIDVADCNLIVCLAQSAVTMTRRLRQGFGRGTRISDDLWKSKFGSLLFMVVRAGCATKTFAQIMNLSEGESHCFPVERENLCLMSANCVEKPATPTKCLVTFPDESTYVTG